MNLVHTLLLQLYEPYFLYPLILTSVMAATSYAILRIFKICDPRVRSLFYMAPLVIPVFIYAFYPPLLKGVIVLRRIALTLEPGASTQLVYFFGNGLSLTGLLCVSGLVFGSLLLVLLYLRGDRIVCWLQGVVEVDPDDEPGLYGIVEKLSERAGIPVPRIGITENLRPNAFTVGYGRRNIVVFSSGLLELLDESELEAVVAHEVAHIGNRDFHILALMSALKTIIFFNPLVYPLASAIIREREALADDVGCSLLDQPKLLSQVLTKLFKVSDDGQIGVPRQLIFRFFIISDLDRRLFALHPTPNMRLNRFADGKYKSKTSRDGPKTIIAAMVMTIVILSFSIPLLSLRGSAPFTKEILVGIEYPEANIGIFNIVTENGTLSFLPNFNREAVRVTGATPSMNFQGVDAPRLTVMRSLGNRWRRTG